MNVHDSLKKYGLAGLSLKPCFSRNVFDCPSCAAEIDGDDYDEYRHPDGMVIQREYECPRCKSRVGYFYELDCVRVFFDGMAAKEEA